MRATKLEEFTAHSSTVNCLQIGRKTAGVLVTGGEDRKVNLWAIGKSNALTTLAGHTSAVDSVTFDPDEQYIAAGGQNGTIKIWSLDTYKVDRSLSQHRSSCMVVQYNPFGKLLASGSLDCNVKVWDIRAKACVQTMKGHTTGVVKLAISPDSRWLASGSESGELKIWDVSSGRLLQDLKGHAGRITSLQFHPQEFLLASSSADKTARVWDLETWDNLVTLGPEAVPVKALAFQGSGTEVVTATQDGLKVWSWETQQHWDTVAADWGKLADLALHDHRLIGCTHNLSAVGVWVVDLKAVAPWCPPDARPASPPRAAVAGAAAAAPANGFPQQQQQHPFDPSAPPVPAAMVASRSYGTVTPPPGVGPLSYNRQLNEQQRASAAASQPAVAAAQLRTSPWDDSQQQQQQQRRLTADQDSSPSYSVMAPRQASAPTPPSAAPASSTGRPGQLAPAAAGDGGRPPLAPKQPLSPHSGKQRLSGGGYVPDVEIRVPAGGPPPPAARRASSSEPHAAAFSNGRRATGQDDHTPPPAASSGRPASAGVQPTESYHSSPSMHERGQPASVSAPHSRGPSPHRDPASSSSYSRYIEQPAAPAADPVIAAAATTHPGLARDLSRMMAALQVAKGFMQRGNMEGALKSILSHNDAALSAMLLEALQSRPEAFELGTVEAVVKLAELVLAGGQEQQMDTALNVLSCVLRGPGRVIKDILRAPGGIGCDLSYDRRKNRAQVAQLALQGVLMRLGVIGRQSGSQGLHAQQLAAEIKQLIS